MASLPVFGDTYSSDFDTIAVDVSFSEAVTVTGTPQLALAIGTQTRQADYSSGSGSSSLRFTYEVQYSDVDTDGISIAANALTLNGGAIRDSDNNNAALALGAHAISDASGHKVEGRVALSVAGPPENGSTYGVNELVEVHVNWPWRVTAGSPFGRPAVFSPTAPGGSGSAQLTLGIGSATRQVQAPLTAGESVSRLFFAYEVQSGDVDANGLSVAAGALTVTGGTIQYSDGAAARLNFGAYAFANDPDLKINGGADNAPVVTKVIAATFPGRGRRTGDTGWRNGERIELAVVFNEPVSVTGAPRLALTIGAGTRQAGLLRCGGDSPLVGAFFASGFCPERVLVFGYVVQPSDVDADGISIAANALTLNGGAIVDRGGNAATRSIPASTVASSSSRFYAGSANPRHKVNGGGTDMAPVVVRQVSLIGERESSISSSYRFPLVSSPQVGDTFVTGETIEVSLLYNEPVTVTGTPRLALRVGAQTRQAGYLRCAAYAGDPAETCRLLTFGYTVQSADSDSNGIGVFNTQSLNGGTIRDRGGNNPNLQIAPDVSATAYFRHTNRKVDGSMDRAPSVSGVSILSSPQSGDSYGARESVRARVRFDEAVTVTGSPQLALTVGTNTRQAAYEAGSGTNALTFAYAVQSTDADTNGVSVAATALALNGGSIVDSGGQSAGLGLGAHALPDQSGHKVDGSVDRTPAVSGASLLSSPQEGDAYGVGESIRAEVRFDEPVTVTGVAATGADGWGQHPAGGLRVGRRNQRPHLQLRGAVNGRRHGRDQRRGGALALNGGSIVDSGGQSAGLGLGAHALSAQSGHKVDGSVDRAPAVSGAAVTSSPAGGGAYQAGETIEVTVTYNEPVTVTGSPQLALSVGSGARQAGYLRCSGDAGDPAGTCRRLVFGYEVRPGDAGAVSTGGAGAERGRHRGFGEQQRRAGPWEPRGGRGGRPPGRGRGPTGRRDRRRDPACAAAAEPGAGGGRGVRGPGPGSGAEALRSACRAGSGIRRAGR